MMKLKTTSPICIRIVIAFLQFLSCVQGMTDIENEYLKDLEHALKEIFRINDYDMESKKPKESLVEMFTSRKSKRENEQTISEDARSTAANMPIPKGAAMTIGLSYTELFHEFYTRVADCRFFEFMFGEDYMARRARAKIIFKEAISLLIQVGNQIFDVENLAGALHALGNQAVHMNYNYKSVEFYTCAIAMCKDNAEFFCHRASALMTIQRYVEAINDCYRAIKLRPRFEMAYFGIGCIYFEQGKNIDAILEGFIKVLQINPENHAALEKLQLAEYKLEQQLEWMNDQLGFLRGNGFTPICNYQPDAAQQGTLLVFRPVTEEEEGGGSSVTTWKLVEDEVDDTRTVADFVDLFGRYTVPLE